MNKISLEGDIGKLIKHASSREKNRWWEVRMEGRTLNQVYWLTKMK